MEASNPGLSSALRLWLNTFDLPRKVGSWQDLEDGQTLWHVLGDIDPDYFNGPLPEQTTGKSGDNWIARWQNLKHIDRKVTTYIRDECGQLPNLTRNMNPDLKAIATDGAAEQTAKVSCYRGSTARKQSTNALSKLVESVMFAALFSEVSNERMIAVINELGDKVGHPFRRAIAAAQEDDARMDEHGYTPQVDDDEHGDDDQDPVLGTPLDRDPELEREERLLEAFQRIKELEDRNKELIRDAQETEETLAELKKERKELEDDLERLQQRGISSTQDETGGSSQDDYIADLELQLQTAQSKTEEQERQLERFQADSATKQNMKDELQLLRAERDELAQKAKAAENLKKKILVLQEQEKAAATMRNDLEAMKDHLQEIDVLKERCAQLQKAHEESAKVIANGEQTIFDQKTNRQRLEYENQVIRQRYEQSKEAQSQLMEQVRELEERIQDLEGSAPGQGQVESLDDELDENRATQSKTPARSRRSTLNQVASTDALILQQKLDATTTRLTGLEEKFLNVYQENLGLRDTIDRGEGLDKLKETSYFLRVTTQLEDVTKELESFRSKYIATVSEHADLKHRLEAVTTGDKNANLEALRENKERQEYVERIEKELHEYKSLLEHAYRSGFDIKNSDVRDSKEYKLIKHQVSSVREAPAEDVAQVIDNTSARLADKQISGWKDLQEMAKVVELTGSSLNIDDSDEVGEMSTRCSSEFFSSYSGASSSVMLSDHINGGTAESTTAEIAIGLMSNGLGVHSDWRGMGFSGGSMARMAPPSSQRQSLLRLPPWRWFSNPKTC